MPPKKAPGKKGKKGGKKEGGTKKGGKGDQRPASAASAAGGAAGGAVPESLEDLKRSVELLRAELESEREQRNFFQLERDKINAFWEISKKELDDERASVRSKDREIQESDERHQVEMKVYKQKIRHLLYEHKLTIGKLKKEEEVALKLQSDDYRERESDMKKEKRSLKVEMKEQALAHEDTIKALKMEHDKNITKLRQEFERQLKEMQLKYEKRMKQLREELELRRKAEIHEIEERKNEHINDLMNKHEKAFADIKNYYNDITTNNLDLIKELKEEVANMKKNEAHNEKIMFEIAQENKRLSEPLTRALKEVDQLRLELANYEKDKLSLKNAKARVVMLENEMKQLRWEYDVLQQRFEKVQKERDDLYEKFESTIFEVQQKTGFRNLLLEKKLEALSETLEKKDAQLGEVLSAANLDPATLGAVTRKLDDLLEAKNQMIKSLEYELAKVTKSHNDVIRVYETKLQEYGVPVEELGFRPLMTKTTTGPAGLVVGSS